MIEYIATTPAKAPSGNGSFSHRGYGERKARIALSRGRDHRRRQVETNDALEPSGKESRDMAWAATDVGDDPARCDVAELVGICRCNGVVSGPDSMLGHVTNAR
jgi:hypothetical protein